MSGIILLLYFTTSLIFVNSQFSCSVVSDSLRHTDCSTPGLPVHHQLLEFTQIHVHWVSDAIQPSHLCHSLLPLSILPSIGVFSNESVHGIKGFNFSICPSNEYSGLISFRIDWFYLLAVQGILKSLLHHHSSKESVLWCTAFFIIQLSHPYMTIEKTIALTRCTFIGKAMALLFNILSRLITTFLLRSRSLLISWVQSLAAMILEPPKIKSVTVSIVPYLFTIKWWDQMQWS